MTTLEPIEGYAGAYLVRVAYQKSPHGRGAVHYIDSGTIRLAMKLGIPQASSIFFTPHEYNEYLLKLPPSVSSSVRFYVVTSGTFRAILFDPLHAEKRVFVVDLKPTVDLVVPAGLAVAFQSLSANRASFLVVSHGAPHIVEYPLTERFQPYWHGNHAPAEPSSPPQPAA